jgi:hypothetical protein
MVSISSILPAVMVLTSLVSAVPTGDEFKLERRTIYNYCGVNIGENCADG